MNWNLKKFVKTAILVAVVLAGVNASAADLLDSDSALSAFKKRTFLSENDALQWATAIQDVVGVYVVNNEGQITPIGDHVNEKDSPKRLDLKDGKKREIFHKIFEKEKEINLSLAGIFSLGGKNNELDELIISDIVSVTDSTVNSTTCLSKKPITIDNTVTYWCVSAITLSEITNNKYSKTKKLASGSYGIATGSGMHQKNDSLSSSRIVASISVIGPFKNNKLVIIDKSPIATATYNVNIKSTESAKPSKHGKSIDPTKYTKYTEPPATGLEGQTISFHK